MANLPAIILSRSPKWVKDGLSVLIPFFICTFSSYSLATGQNWQWLGIRLDQPVKCMYGDTSTGDVYVGGMFQHVNGVPLKGLVKYGTQGWDSVGTGFPGYDTRCIQRFGSELWVGSTFHLSRYDGVSWQDWGMHGYVTAMMEYDGKVLVAGTFDSIAGLRIPHLAAWDGQNWMPFHGSDTVMDVSVFYVNDMVAYEGRVILGGNLNYSPASKDVFQWDGQSWSEIPGGPGGVGFQQVIDLEVYNGELYAAGSFSEVQGDPGNNIARWDGSMWRPLGTGLMNGPCYGMGVWNGKLVAGGYFFDAGGVPVKFIANWDGNSWCRVPGDFNGSPNRFTHTDRLYIGGGFDQVDSSFCHYLARWVGNEGDPCGLTGEVDEVVPDRGIMLCPNPASDGFSIAFGNGTLHSGKVSVLDIAGRVVLSEQTWRMGDAPIEVSHLPAGVYLVQVCVRDRTEYIKLIKN